MVCPNCGQTFEGDRCPNCGRPTGGSAFNRVLAVIITIFLVLPAALFGACSALVGVSTFGTRDGWQMGVLMLGLAALGGGAAFGLAYLAKNLWK